MSSERPKLRGKQKARSGPYPIGEFPNDVVLSIGKQIVHRLAIGLANITGDDFGGIFAEAIGGQHFACPIGVTDVEWDQCSWSAKTVQNNKPFTTPIVRLISGRNSVSFSYGIKDPFVDIDKTGESVLNIWNERVNQSFSNHDDLRVVVLIRNISRLEFTLFEYEATRYTPADYKWHVNDKNNFYGFDKITDVHRFTWQPHGSQFTLLKQVPGSACKFRIARNPKIIEKCHVLELIGFEDDWIERIQ